MNLGEKTLETMNSANWYNNWIMENIKDHLKGEILEVGAGIGNFSQKLSEFGQVTAIDIEEKYITDRKDNYIKMGFGDIEKGKYFFNNKKFNCVVCFNVLEHVEKETQALKNIYMLLEKEGYLILLVPAHKLLYSKFDRNIGHYRRYSKEVFKKNLQNIGFTVDKIKYFNCWGAIGWFVYMKILKSKEIPGYTVSVFDNLGKFFLGLEKYIQPPFGLSVIAICKKV